MTDHTNSTEHNVSADTETMPHGAERNPSLVILAAAALACCVSGASVAGGVGTYFVLQYRVAQVEQSLTDYKAEVSKQLDRRDALEAQLTERVRSNEASADKHLQRVDDLLGVILGRLNSIETKLDEAAAARPRR